MIKGTIGLLYDYPNERPNTLEYQTRTDQPGRWHTASLMKKWIPDAFIGLIASLIEAIETGGEPITSGADNLKTLQIVQLNLPFGQREEGVPAGRIRSVRTKK